MDRGQQIRIAVTAVVVIAALAGLAWFNRRTPDAASLPDAMASGLEGLKTIQGRLDLAQGAVTLEHELWVERPRFMRAEIEAGPEPFQGTIVVFNPEEAWVYVPALDVATVADRSDRLPEEGLNVGSSILETLPQDVLSALRNAGDLQIVGEEEVAGRKTLRVQIFLEPEQNEFKANQLTVWLDKRFFYPLALESDTGFRLRFQMVKFNEAIDPATFIFVPPPGATVRRVK